MIGPEPLSSARARQPGSYYYQVLVTLLFGAGAPPKPGKLVLSRVSDIEGAAPGQLRWQIERGTIGQEE